ncbi:MAG TPA: lytic murein transglycosylase [Rhodobacterales bacterium]|nr:lytic murein transglycosylase [Rhodobacterales bacterium]
MPSTPHDDQTNAFVDWLFGPFKARALDQSIHRKTLEKALSEITFLPDILARQQNQKEFNLQIWEYLDITVSGERVRKGRKKLRDHRALFNRIEGAFGIEAEVIAAIWGLETGYGVIRGNTPVLSALATLAFSGRRAAYFESELIAGLRVAQTRSYRQSAMQGSWAGALGHGQFMPSAVIDFAVDFDGDGQRDLCRDDPADALASIANYLKKHAWKKGQPWGVEVRLPDGFDYALAGLDRSLPSQDWAAHGVITVEGSAVPDYGPGSILVPAGARGVALLVLRNFHVITSYNRSQSYAIAIGHLSDRLLGGPPFAANWPINESALTQREVTEAQYALTRAGYDTLGTDGLQGPNTLAALRRWQQDRGKLPDGFLSRSVLAALRGH